MPKYLVKTVRGTYEIETTEPEDSSFLSEAKSVGARGVEGIADLIGLAELPLKTMDKTTNWLAGKILGHDVPSSKTYLSDLLQSTVKDVPEPETFPGKVLGEIGYYAPSAFIPGGEFTQALKSALAAGTAAGLTKAAGAGETGQAVAGLLGAGAPAALKKIGKGLTKSAVGFEKSALDIRPSAQRKMTRGMSRRQASLLAEQKTPLIEKILEGVRSRGVLKGSKETSEIITRNNDAIDELGSAAANILKQADAISPEVLGDISPDIKFNHVKQYLKQHPYEKKALRDQLVNRMNTINAEWDGTLKGLNDLKQRLYQIAYSGGTESKRFDRALASDLKDTIEKSAEKILNKKSANALKKINEQLGEHLAFSDILLDLARQESGPQGLAKFLKRVTSAPIGGSATGALLGLATGRPGLMALGAALGLLGTKAGKYGTAGALRGAGNLAELFGGSSYRGVSPVVASLFSSPENTRTAEDFIEKKKQIMIENKNEIDPIKFEDAIMQVESGGDPHAVNKRTGAKGAFQFLDDTGEWVLHTLMKSKEKYDPFNLDQQRRIFRHYFFKYLIPKFKDPRLALAAYNWGEGNVARLLREGPDIPGIEKYFPQETQNYINKVMGLI